ncbi:hypothetical protein MNBD_BACTEROID05-38 [hydrothermal vent metagenome]|uniref:Uncharacterized protein n=1 Tax=hydrothermal vent metagenome TaxID=652676 RepID=A0A3B0TVK8_9ZZZZ
MREVYITEYKSDRQLRASLELFKSYALFNTPVIQSRSHFIVIFIRLADRCLYHSIKTWSLFVSDLNVPVDFLQELGDDAWMETNDVASKYEIEAYLAAAKTLFEKNFIGVNEQGKQNILGGSFNGNMPLLTTIKGLFEKSRAAFFSEANKIRNHSYHINRQLRDAGFTSKIVKSGNSFKVALPNMYEVNNADIIDLAELFISTHKDIVKLLREVREILLQYLFEQHGRPSNNTYLPIETPFGNMIVSLGPEGFDFEEFNKP